VNIIYPSDGLVGLEIKDPSMSTIVARTIKTGDSTPYNLAANIEAAYLCDSVGNQQSSTPLPTQSNQVTPYYYIRVSNNLGTIQNMRLAITIFDANGLPITMNSQPITVGPYSSFDIRTNFLIQPFAHYGTAYAYVSVFSDNHMPSEGGVPLALEKIFQFSITGGTPFSGTAPTTFSLNGIKHYYNFTYRLPKTCGIGTYTAYSTADYLGIHSSTSTTFQVAQIGDLNSDGAVNYRDISAFVSYYIGYFNNHVFVQAIDFNSDGRINFNDIQVFVSKYIFYWSP
jgi:hypothetical protein